VVQGDTKETLRLFGEGYSAGRVRGAVQRRAQLVAAGPGLSGMTFQEKSSRSEPTGQMVDRVLALRENQSSLRAARGDSGHAAGITGALFSFACIRARNARWLKS
jgi:hypothetical protein